MQPITYRSKSRSLGKLWHWLLAIPIFAAWPLFRFMGRDWDRFVAFDWIADWTAVYTSWWSDSSVFLSVLLGLMLPCWFWLYSPKRNFLLLDRVGLTYWKAGYVQRQWCWDELSAFTLEAGQSGPGHIVFTLPEGETIPTPGFRIAKTSQVRIEDSYDAPLAEIAARLNACREQAPDTAPALRPVTIGTDTSLRAWGALARSVHVLTMLGILAAGAWLLYETSRFVPGEPPSEASFGRLNGAFAALLAVVVPGFVLLVLLVLPKFNQLRLDRDGLTVVRLGRKRHWAWRDLAILDLRPGWTKGYFGRRGLMALAATGGDWPSRFLRRWYGLAAAGPAFIVEDTYAIPLERIAGRLNEYRDLVLGGGPDLPERT